MVLRRVTDLVGFVYVMTSAAFGYQIGSKPECSFGYQIRLSTSAVIGYQIMVSPSEVIGYHIVVSPSTIIGYQIGGHPECSYWLGRPRVSSSVVSG